MTKKIINQSFYVVGIEARTSNALEAGPKGIIPSQWEKFIQGDYLSRIPNKINSSIIAGYTSYQSNKDGEYSFFLGTQVSSCDVVPEGMSLKEVHAGPYLVRTSDKGPMGKVVYELWTKIWNLAPGEIGSETTRSYQFDYEVYDHRSSDPNQAEVDVYVGLV